MLGTQCPPPGQVGVGSLGQKKAGQKTRPRWKGAEDIRRMVEFRVHHGPLRIIDSEDERRGAECTEEPGEDVMRDFSPRHSLCISFGMDLLRD